LRGAACDDQSRMIARMRGLRNEARAMLADIYGWFTEGLRHLKDAKAWLDVASVRVHSVFCSKLGLNFATSRPARVFVDASTEIPDRTLTSDLLGGVSL
jgi:hypothetical protein